MSVASLFMLDEFPGHDEQATAEPSPAGVIT